MSSLVSDYVSAWSGSPFADVDLDPWSVTQAAEALVRSILSSLGSDYFLENEAAVHRTAVIEPGAVLKGPLVIGSGGFVAAGAYLRGGCYLAEDVIIGPGSELKTSFVFPGSKLAHLSFVGDSILGANVNIEAGAVIANYRNEWSDKQIRISSQQGVIDTGVDKFGALVGDHSRIGANAVVAPGALIEPFTKVGRLQLIDQAPPP